MNFPADYPALRFSGAVLAGGHSARMGRDKAGLVLPDGRTWLEHAVGVLRAAGATEVLVSVRAGQSYALTGTREVSDATPDAGPLAGLAAALAAAREPWVVVVSVDLVDLTPAFVRELVGRAQAEKRGVVPVNGAGVQPLAAIYPAETAALATAAVASGRRAVRRWVEELHESDRVRLWPVTGGNAAALRNCNTPEDWAGRA